MPKGPRGEKRKADVIGNAVLVMRIATGQETDNLPRTKRGVGGKKGGVSRAKRLSPKKRAEIAKKAAKARWDKQ